MVKPFLSIYTPTYKRPTFLAKNRQSVQSQSMAAMIEHVVVEDKEGLGIGGMYLDIKNHVDKVNGEYVLILSDDNVLRDESAVASLWNFARASEFRDVIIWRGILGARIVPPNPLWKKRPYSSYIDLSNFIVRTPLWKKYASSWIDSYAADFHFIDMLWENNHQFSWHDYLGYRTVAVMHGASEDQWNAQNHV